MRAQVANLAGMVDQLRTGMSLDRGLLRHQAEQLSELRQELDEAKQMAVEHSALFQAEELRVPQERGTRSEITLTTRCSPAMASPASAGNCTEAMKLVSLPVMLADVIDDRLDGMRHVRVRFRDGSWGYAISKDALYSLPRERLVKEVAKQLALQIVNSLRGPR